MNLRDVIFSLFDQFAFIAIFSCRILDNLPVAMVHFVNRIKTYDRGFPVGQKLSLSDLVSVLDSLGKMQIYFAHFTC